MEPPADQARGGLGLGLSVEQIQNGGEPMASAPTPPSAASLSGTSLGNRGMPAAASMAFATASHQQARSGTLTNLA